MKKIICLRFTVVFILCVSLLTTCDIIFPDDEDYGEFVVIYKAEWDLIEDTTVHEFEVLPLGFDIQREYSNRTWVLPSNPTNNEKALHNTLQINKALDHFMEQGFKHIKLEKGEYFVGGRVKAISWGTGNQEWGKPETISIQAKHSGLRFDLNGSTLKYEPQDRVDSAVITISGSRSTGDAENIKIFNGIIIGDRIKHRFEDTYPTGHSRAGQQSSHEDGYGIATWWFAKDVELYNLTVKEVTGDCIFANGRNITIRDCDISRGRRNGIVSIYVDTITIYNNKIHCIYEGGEEWNCKEGKHGCKYCPAGTVHPDSQREYFGGGIGAEACIAFEHTSNDNFDKQINIKIYNNVLDGQKPDYRINPDGQYAAKWGRRTYYYDSALNTHWRTYAMWVYNNEIIGDWEWSAGGSNTLIENNRFSTGRKGHRISKGLVSSGSILETGGSAANYVVIRNNYFHNYNVIVGGSSGGVSDSQPHWRHDYAIVDNVFVFDEPREFSPDRDSNGNQKYSTHYNTGIPMSTGSTYWTALCVSVDNTVVMGNVFDVRYGGTPVGNPESWGPPWVDWRGYDHPTIKPIYYAIYIDVFNNEWDRRLPSNLKVDMYFFGNTFIGPVHSEKHYCLNNRSDFYSISQYTKPSHARMPSYYSEIINYDASYAKYKEILRKTTSVGNIWGKVK